MVVYVAVVVAAAAVDIVVADFAIKLIAFVVEPIIFAVRNMDHHFVFDYNSNYHLNLITIYVDYTVANATLVIVHIYHIVVDDYMIRVVVVVVN